MKALIKDGVVQNLSDTEYPPFDNMEWVDCPNDCQPQWNYSDGHFSPPVIPLPIYTKEELLSRFTLAVQAFVNKTAIEKGYDSGLSCASYFASSNIQWKAEAGVFIAWRDAVWERFEIESIAINAGANVPDSIEFIASLPQIVWPS